MCKKVANKLVNDKKLKQLKRKHETGAKHQLVSEFSWRAGYVNLFVDEMETFYAQVEDVCNVKRPLLFDDDGQDKTGKS